MRVKVTLPSLVVGQGESHSHHPRPNPTYTPPRKVGSSQGDKKTFSGGTEGALFREGGGTFGKHLEGGGALFHATQTADTDEGSGGVWDRPGGAPARDEASGLRERRQGPSKKKKNPSEGKTNDGSLSAPRRRVISHKETRNYNRKGEIRYNVRKRYE